MSTDPNRQTSKTSAAPLKASDFFPPGEGWNKATPPEQIYDRGPEEDETVERIERNKH